MRHRYLVCYDISDPKRLARMFRKMHGFGNPLQYSVFCCDLSGQEKVVLEATIKQLINQREDRVLIADIGPVEGHGGKSFQFLGRAVSQQSRSAAVVV